LSLSRIVVVGASLAGLNAVEGLRAAGYDGRLSLVGSESHLPYDRPPLSKQVLDGTWSADLPLLRTGEEQGALDLDLHLGQTATQLDLSSRRVVTDDQTALEFDGLIIATGAHARMIPTALNLRGIHTLRTFEDALAVRSAFDSGARVAVVGAGFIGSEVAASARARNLCVTVLEALPIPLEPILGAEMGAVCAGLHHDNGVEIRHNAMVEGFEGTGQVEGVRLMDGSVIPADVVVVGVGVTPATGWLQSSGIHLDDGVVCDAYCATSAPGVYAAGDIARWHHRWYRETIRVEHWNNAVEQGVVAGQNLLAGPDASTAFVPVPYFWSDQYGVRIQFAGRRYPSGEFQVVHGSIKTRDFVAIYEFDDCLTAVIAFDRPHEFIVYRRLLAKHASWDEALSCSDEIIE
jgi:NADPH-dependent 2,4-dienoyl-CoA reductase/sulfur reductase-like enzyme